jgi:hypothetical protein
MVKRRGIGATMAASVVFSVLLVASLAVFVSSQARAGLYSASNAGDSLGDGFQIIEAAEGANVLLYVQDALGSGTLGCASALSAIGSVSESQSEGNLTVTASAKPVVGGDLSDNLTALYPFDGSVSGALDLAVRFEGSGGDGPGVTFSRVETHYVHMDARLEEEAANCLGAVMDIEETISGSTIANCSTKSIGPLVQEAEALPASVATRDGFSFRATYALSDAGACDVNFLVSLVQPDVTGPAGQFDVRLEQAGSVPIATSS